MSRRKISTTVYIEPEQDELLKRLSARTHVPVAAYIRRGVDLVLEANRDVLPGQLALFPSPLAHRPGRGPRKKRGRPAPPAAPGE